MPNTWIVDLRQYLDADGAPGQVSGPALGAALLLGAIVAWVTSHPSGQYGRTNVPCRRSPGRRRCGAEIMAGLGPVGEAGNERLRLQVLPGNLRPPVPPKARVAPMSQWRRHYHFGRGRPRKAAASAQDMIRRQVQTPPSAFGYLFRSRTEVTLCAHLAGLFSLQPGRASARPALLQLGFRWPS